MMGEDAGGCRRSGTGAGQRIARGGMIPIIGVWCLFNASMTTTAAMDWLTGMIGMMKMHPPAPSCCCWHRRPRSGVVAVVLATITVLVAAAFTTVAERQCGLSNNAHETSILAIMIGSWKRRRRIGVIMVEAVVVVAAHIIIMMVVSSLHDSAGDDASS